MKYLFINTTGGTGSTGRICLDLAKKLMNEGHFCKIAYGRKSFGKVFEQEFGYRIGSKGEILLHGLTSRVLDNHGLGSYFGTKKFLKWAEEYNPDILWLHNLHGYYINYKLLFQWIKTRPSMKVYWTLHDCWAFTGHCTHFEYSGCNKWEKGCINCPQKKEYPTSYVIDNSKKNYKIKKEVFTGVKDLTLITPSQWLSDLATTSFLKEYSVIVKKNTIDKSVFKPTESSFRKEHSLENKKIILGVSNGFGERKGKTDFISLSQMLGEEYALVLVGLAKKEIKKTYKEFNKNITIPKCNEKVFDEIKRTENGVIINKDINALFYQITGKTYNEYEKRGKASVLLVERTKSAEILAQIYTSADVFVNPTYEDNYPTVNLEAIACGTKVIAYNSGGTMETI